MVAAALNIFPGVVKDCNASIQFSSETPRSAMKISTVPMEIHADGDEVRTWSTTSSLHVTRLILLYQKAFYSIYRTG